MSSAKVAPLPPDEAAAIKVQALTRGKLARKNTAAAKDGGSPGKGGLSFKAQVVATDAGVKKMEEKMMSNKHVFSMSGSDGGRVKSWSAVRKAAGIKFDSWDMALQVVEAG